MSKKKEPSMDEAEMITILEEIARGSGNAAAKLAAIKELRDIRGGKPPKVKKSPEKEAEDEFADLDAAPQLHVLSS